MRGRLRERPIHPIIQRSLDAAGHSTFTEAARGDTTKIKFLCTLAEPEKIEGFVDKVQRWASACGVTPREFLKHVAEHIEEVQAKKVI